MKTALTVNLTTRSVNDGGSAWSPPTLTFGEELTLSLHFQKNIAGAPADYYPTLNSLTAAIGRIDARPTGGSFKLKIGTGAQSSANTTAALPFNCTVTALVAAINALTAITTEYGTVVGWESGGSLFMLFGSGSVEVPLTVVNNQLWPLSFGKITASQRDSQWIHELRLVQSPVAFTGSSAVVLPPAPSLSYVQHGGASGDGLIIFDTIMALNLPTDFKGSYQFVRNYVPTTLISLSDGTDVIAGALSIYGAGIKATNPLPNTAYIDWGGDFAGGDVAMPTIVVASAPPGDPTFTIALDQAELLAMLRFNPSVTLPLEVRLVIVDEDTVAREIVAFSIPITINRPVIFPELALMPNIDWLRPPSPKDYVPFNSSQVITGQQYYQAVLGDDSHSNFVVAHGLATEAVFVFGRINSNGGRQLIDGTDFTATIDSANQVTVTSLIGVPSSNAWAFFVMSAQTVGAFASGLTIEMAQVTGLNAALADIGAQLAALNTLLPGNAHLTTDVSSTSGFTIPILPFTKVLFAPAGALPGRAPYMLPAVHNATVNNTSIAPTPNAGSVWTNNSGGDLIIPGGGGIRSSTAAAAGNIASDGRIAYPARRSGTTISYYPIPFEQTLWNIFINDKMFPQGSKCTVWFSLALQLINATSEAQYVVVIEKGVAARDVIGSPDTTATNLQNIVWDVTTPILRQQLILTPASITHTFGCQIANNTTGLTANAYLYNQIVAANAAAPSIANFSLRARLIEFDTENSITTARGWVSAQLLASGQQTLGAVIQIVQ